MQKWLRVALIALSILGLAVSVYMTIYKLSANDAMCLGSGDCSTVNNSPYADINGFPVAALGILGYAAIFSILMLEQRFALLRQNGDLILFGLALTGFIFTLWLIYVEVALIRALCPFCLVSQATMTLIFILIVIRLTKSPQD
ncbi:MAG: hypothetical protein Fur002_06910 [Anaerolineales bacterium]